MKSIAYLNGNFLPLEDTKISPLDRGFLFGDSLYEVIPAYNGKLFTLNAHLNRLFEGLKEIHMASPYPHSDWRYILQTLVDKNGGNDQCVYLQVSRGQDPTRNQGISDNTPPTVFAFSYAHPKPTKAELLKGIKATAITDIRWKYAHIKACSKLAYVLMLEEAKAGGGDEGIIINNGYVTEGTISNVFIVRHGVIITPPKSSLLLSGITRDLVLLLAEKNNIPYRETKISERDCTKADEMWVTSSSHLIRPVLEFNGEPVNNGKAGPMWETLWELYEQETNKFSLPISA